jgi:DNA-directed RNA polymerase specialized sigma24 family protein
VDFLDTDTSMRARPRPEADDGVTVLYAAHAVGLIRLGFVMLGDRGAAEDVVQDAFLGLYRNREAAGRDGGPAFDSAEAAVLLSEEHREVLAAVRGLAPRQREVLTLRYYLTLSTEETARAMGISVGAVKSTLSRAIATLGRTFKEES